MNREILEGLFPATMEAQKKQAAEILRQALNDESLMDGIKERASIRWAEGYSDSLYMAVLSGITSTGEIVERDEYGNIILKSKTDWEKEITSLTADGGSPVEYVTK